VNRDEAVEPRIDSVMAAFHVQDMDRAVEFYTQKLGFHVHFKNGAVFTIVARDNIEISFVLNSDGTLCGHAGCYLKVANVQAFHDDFRRHGIEMTHPLRTEKYGMREFMITDPDGNMLNFGEPVVR
jgi:catechol 2,3-dioxygenase-like lactoylglutathione lyase family enzyme